MPVARNLRVSVNVAARQLRRADFIEHVEGALARSGLPPQRLMLELTEYGTLDGDEAVVERLRCLRALGTKIVLDDFGMGYSWLRSIHCFPLDMVKIDRSFVSDLAENGDSVIRLVLSLAQDLGIDVIAEGVENGLQAARLTNHGCELAQGFLYSMPLAHEDMHEFMHSRAWVCA